MCIRDRFDSRNQSSLLFRIFWNNFPRTLVRVIGRYEVDRKESKFGFKMGKLMASFQGGGYIFCEKMELKRERRYGEEFG